MASHNLKPEDNLVALLMTFLITAGLLGSLWHWFYSSMTSQGLPSLAGTDATPPSELDLTQRFSQGEQPLIDTVTPLARQEGITAFAQGDYPQAVLWFEESLQVRPNDPETLIYLNNARLRATGTPTYAIAASVPIGRALNIAQEILRGVAQAQDEINRQGGINGVGLEVSIVNDDNDPTLTPDIALELSQQRQILAVVGHNTSDASLGAAPIYQRHGLVMISPTTFDPAVSRAGSAIFRAVPTAQSMAAALVNHIMAQLPTPARMLVCYDATAPDNAVFRNAVIDTLVAQGGEIVNGVDAQGRDLCNFASPGFEAEAAIANALAQGANSLYLGPGINHLDPAIQVARVNAGRLPLFSSPSLYTQAITQNGQQAVEGLVLVAPWSPDAHPDFARRAQALWKATVNWRTATAYDATQAIIAGLHLSNTRQGLNQVLRQPDFSTPGAGEPVRFLDTRDRRLAPVLVQIQPDQSGGYRFLAFEPAR